MATQIAKHMFGVPRTLCRIYDPIREEITATWPRDDQPTIVGLSS
jgi:Trk K+ transport system NAD-binding subunit